MRPKNGIAIDPFCIKIPDPPKRCLLDRNLNSSGTPWAAKNHQNLRKCLPKGALFTPSEKRLENRRFLDPPETSELSWRLHKTSIFTYPLYPQNGIEMTSQNLPFWTPLGSKTARSAEKERV